MQLKKHIALVFVLVFFGKLLTVDTNLFVLMENSGDVTFLKPYCKNNKAGGEDTAEFAKAAMASAMTMELMCQVPFDLKLSEWPAPLADMNFQQYGYINPGQPMTPQDKFYPPPKA